MLYGAKIRENRNELFLLQFSKCFHVHSPVQITERREKKVLLANQSIFIISWSVTSFSRKSWATAGSDVEWSHNTIRYQCSHYDKTNFLLFRGSVKVPPSLKRAQIYHGLKQMLWASQLIIWTTLHALKKKIETENDMFCSELLNLTEVVVIMMT